MLRTSQTCFSLLMLAALPLSVRPSLAGDYAEAIRNTPGLLVHYRFETSGETADDASGEGRDAKLAGDVSPLASSAHASLGAALRLSSGGHLKVPDLGQHDALSIELWIKLRQNASEGIAALYAADGWTSQFVHFNLKSSGGIELAIHGVGEFPNTAPQSLQIDRWTHLVATYDRAAAAQRIYANGRLLLDIPAAPALPVRLAEAAVGVWMNNQLSRPLVADIDELALYNVALAPGQVRSHYLAGRGVDLKPVDFATQIRPILAERCFACHGPEKQENGLRLDVRDAAFRGGESGEPAIAAYDAETSHLLHRVTDKDEPMPPEGPPLSETQVALLRSWIDQGAAWPDELAGRIEAETVATQHWSFQPLQKIVPPASEHPFVASGNAIDAFVFVRLQEQSLSPSPEADRRTLLRRLHLDLHGLPPTPEEIAAFAADDSPQAWETAVDRALASPRYGERWASHWLDVIRYGDTHGFEVNTPRDNAWPYRDWVVKSLNEDKPYDQFLRQQVAGDQLGVDAATGFLVAAPALLQGQVGKDLASIRQARMDELHEVIVSIGSGVLGLTIGCARCHNHKFDPVSQRDYYQLQAVFAGLHYGDRPVRSPDECRLGESSMTPPAKAAFAGTFSTPGPTHRLYRGDPMQRREQVAPDIPAVLGTLRLESTSDDGARRLALARWLTDAANPLTPRVIVNRVWQHHFGEGLSPTPSDFGAMGVPPSHPELLDWLAGALVDEGWSLKRLHRRVLLSNTYRQASYPRPECLAVDANTKLLWRYPPRRLDMEPIRDSILAVSGALDLTMGGPGFSVFKPNKNYVRVYDAREEWTAAEWRRMIYVHRVRMAQDGVFGAFDCPDAGQPAPKRSRSTTALQALSLANSSFVQQQAGILAERVRREAGDDRASQLRLAFQLAWGREPSTTEQAAARHVADKFGLAAVCRALFNSNEFLFLN